MGGTEPVDLGTGQTVVGGKVESACVTLPVTLHSAWGCSYTVVICGLGELTKDSKMCCSPAVYSLEV